MGKLAKDKVLIRIEAINLVSLSDCVKQYPKIRAILDTHREQMQSIYLSDIVYLLNQDVETYNTLLYSFKSLQEIAAKEWSQEAFVGDYKNKCQLCGNPKLLHNYKIRNIKNNCELIVGSECINKFGAIDNKKFDARKHRREQEKVAKEIKRRNLLNERFPNCKEHLDSWRGYYTELELLMSEKIDSRFKKLISDSNNFYNDFISGTKYTDSDVNKLNDWYKEFEQLKLESTEFINDYKEDKLIANKEIGDWLIKNKLNGVRQQIIREDARISTLTVGYLGVPEFIDRFEGVFKKEFLRFGYELQKITDEKVVFKRKFRMVNIILIANLKDFMQSFGGLIFNNDILSEQLILNNLNLEWEDKNVANLEWELDNILKKTRFNLSLYFIENILKIFQGDYVAKVKADVFLTGHRLVIGLSEDQAREKLLNTIKGINKWELSDSEDDYIDTMYNKY